MSASTGFTPFYLTYGQHPRVPATLFGEGEGTAPSTDSANPAADAFVADLRRALVGAEQRLQGAQARQKAHADRSRRELAFAVGDKVLLSTANFDLPGLGARKIAPRFCGPFIVTKLCGPNAVELDLPKVYGRDKAIHNVVNVSRIKPFVDGSNKYPGREIFAPPPTTEINGQDAYEVQCFLKERPRKKNQPAQFLVRWAGYAAEHDLWLPEDQLRTDLKSEFPKFVKALRDSDAAKAAKPISTRRTRR